ncbi:hypothetical protein HPB50_021383 [Hyalomma asiaticum]|uniref:Uncharacterized protein n=1 Tax=Hyalomma asiaticum TaxID=266040 RepID=A0ACB7RKA8_HYAAI|nr:hypothetical protein HPB50_021383 [Hyalomma asiaticum]
MEMQRSMMLSRAMSQRSVVIRPATQDTGGMMQYLLTIVFLIVVFWVCVFVYIQFFRAKEAVGVVRIHAAVVIDILLRISDKLTTDSGDGLSNASLVDSLIRSFTGMTHKNKGQCYRGACYDDTSAATLLLRRELFQTGMTGADPKALALVSVDYGILTTKKDNFKNSLEKFLTTYSNVFWRDRFQGFEIRGVPLADYLNDAKMAALNTIVNTAAANATKAWSSKPCPSILLGGLFFAGATAERATASSCRIATLCETAAANATKAWSSKPCPSILLGGLFFAGATAERATASSCRIATLCEAHPRGKPAGSETAGRVALIRRASTDSFIYDTETKIQAKAKRARAARCLYVDHIELDDANCTCQDRDQFPLLSSVRKGME